MALILNQSQAEAIYSAMCALNNVSARLNCQFDGALNYVNICEDETGQIRIAGRHGEVETYADQSAFATAYGLLPLVTGQLAVRADGQPNHYAVTRDSNSWAAVVQLNGEFTEDRQQAIMARFVAALQS